MKRIFGKKGFTLVELMISLVLFLLLAGAASSIILVSFNLYSRSAVRNTAQIKGDEIFDTIENRLMYAVDVTVTNDDNATGDFCIYIPQYGDRVRIGNTIPPNSDLVSPDELINLTVGATIKLGNEDDLIVLTIEILSADEPVYSRSGAIKLMNALNPDISESCSVPKITTNYSEDMYIVFGEIG